VKFVCSFLRLFVCLFDCFGRRGTCLVDPRIARQYSSFGDRAPFVDISNHSCLNSWMGGNIAPRPLDVARFMYSTFSGKLLSPVTGARISPLPPPLGRLAGRILSGHWGAPSYPRTTRRPHDGLSIAGLPLMDAHAFLNPPRAEVTDRAPQNVPVAGYTQSGLRFSRRTTFAPCCNIVQHAATQSDTSHSMGLPVGGFWPVCWRVVFAHRGLAE
jgi:hypothetical protein